MAVVSERAAENRAKINNRRRRRRSQPRGKTVFNRPLGARPFQRQQTQARKRVTRAKQPLPPRPRTAPGLPPRQAPQVGRAFRQPLRRGNYIGRVQRQSRAEQLKRVREAHRRVPEPKFPIAPLTAGGRKQIGKQFSRYVNEIAKRSHTDDQTDKREFGHHRIVAEEYALRKSSPRNRYALTQAVGANIGSLVKNLQDAQKYKRPAPSAVEQRDGSRAKIRATGKLPSTGRLTVNLTKPHSPLKSGLSKVLKATGGGVSAVQRGDPTRDTYQRQALKSSGVGPVLKKGAGKALTEVAEFTGKPGRAIWKWSGAPKQSRILYELMFDPLNLVGGGGVGLRGGAAAARTATRLGQKGVNVENIKSLRESYQRALDTGNARPFKKRAREVEKARDKALKRAGINPKNVTIEGRVARAAADAPRRPYQQVRGRKNRRRIEPVPGAPLPGAAAAEAVGASHRIATTLKSARRPGFSIKAMNPMGVDLPEVRIPRTDKRVDLSRLRVNVTPPQWAMRNLGVKTIPTPAVQKTRVALAMAEARRKVHETEGPKVRAASERLRRAENMQSPEEFQQASQEVLRLQKETQTKLVKATEDIENKITSPKFTWQMSMAAGNRRRAAHQMMMHSTALQRSTRSAISQNFEAAVQPIRKEFKGEEYEKALMRAQLRAFEQEGTLDAALPSRRLTPQQQRAEQAVLENLRTFYDDLAEQGLDVGFLRGIKQEYMGTRMFKPSPLGAGAEKQVGKGRSGSGFMKSRKFGSAYEVANPDSLANDIAWAYDVDTEAARRIADQLHTASTTRVAAESVARTLARGTPVPIESLTAAELAGVREWSEGAAGVFRSLDDPANEGHVLLREGMRDKFPMQDTPSQRARLIEDDLARYEHYYRALKERGDDAALEHAKDIEVIVAKLEAELNDDIPLPAKIDNDEVAQLEKYVAQLRAQGDAGSLAQAENLEKLIAKLRDDAPAPPKATRDRYEVEGTTVIAPDGSELGVFRNEQDALNRAQFENRRLHHKRLREEPRAELKWTKSDRGYKTTHDGSTYEIGAPSVHVSKKSGASATGRRRGSWTIYEDGKVIWQESSQKAARDFVARKAARKSRPAESRVPDEVEVRARDVKVGDKIAGRMGARDQEVIKVSRDVHGNVALQLHGKGGRRPVFKPDATIRLRRSAPAERRLTPEEIRAYNRSRRQIARDRALKGHFDDRPRLAQVDPRERAKIPNIDAVEAAARMITPTWLTWRGGPRNQTVAIKVSKDDFASMDDRSTFAHYDPITHIVRINANRVNTSELTPQNVDAIRMHLIHELLHARTMSGEGAMFGSATDLVFKYSGGYRGYLNQASKNVNAERTAASARGEEVLPLSKMTDEDFDNYNELVQREARSLLNKEVRKRTGQDVISRIGRMRQKLIDPEGYELRGIDPPSTQGGRRTVLGLAMLPEDYKDFAELYGQDYMLAIESTARFADLMVRDYDDFMRIVGKEDAEWFRNKIQVEAADLQPTALQDSDVRLIVRPDDGRVMISPKEGGPPLPAMVADDPANPPFAFAPEEDAYKIKWGDVNRLPDLRHNHKLVLDPREMTFFRSSAQSRAAAAKAYWSAIDTQYGRNVQELETIGGNHGIDTLYYDAKTGQEYRRPQMTDPNGFTVNEALDWVHEGRVWPTHVVIDANLVLNRAGAYDDVIAQSGKQLFNDLMSHVRFGVTVPFPAYHIRNMISDLLKSLQADSGVIFHPLVNLKLVAGPFMTKRGGKLGKVNVPGVGKMSMPEFLLFADHFGVRSGEHLAEFGQLAVGNITKGYKAPGSVGEQYQKFMRFALNKGMQREDTVRLMTFLQRMRRNGGDAADASWYMIRHHFDYSDLSAYEKRFVRNLFLFYTWYRKNIPLQLVELARRPGFMAGVAMAYYELPRGGTPINMDWSKLHPMLPDASKEVPIAKYTPEYLTERIFAAPVSWNGHTVFFGFGAPWADLSFASERGFSEGVRTTFNPLLQLGSQLFFEPIDPLTGRKLRRSEPSNMASMLSALGIPLSEDKHGRAILPWAANTVLNTLPFFGRGSSLFANSSSFYGDQPGEAWGKRLNWLTGLTPKPMPVPGGEQEKKYIKSRAFANLNRLQEELNAINNLPDKQRKDASKQFLDNLKRDEDKKVVRAMMNITVKGKNLTAQERLKRFMSINRYFPNFYSHKTPAQRRAAKRRKNRRQGSGLGGGSGTGSGLGGGSGL